MDKIMVRTRMAPRQANNATNTYVITYSKSPLYCPSIHRQTRVSPRISAVPFSYVVITPLKCQTRIPPSATVIEDQTVNLLLFKPRS
jgi:hypothetical protein